MNKGVMLKHEKRIDEYTRRAWPNSYPADSLCKIGEEYGELAKAGVECGLGSEAALEEMADVGILVTSLAARFGYSLVSLMQQKMKENERREHDETA